MSGPYRVVRRSTCGRPALRLGLALAVAVAVAACGSAGISPSGSAPASSTPSAAPAAPASSAPSAASAAPAATPASGATLAPPTGLDASPSTSPFGSPAPPVAIDDDLVALLPDTVDGLPVERSSETESAALTSPTLGADADGFAAVQVATTDLADLAIASIVHLKGSTDADAFYAEWRPGFDEAVCAPAGGISTREVTIIGGRSVDTTLCLEGARVYHVRLDDGRILVSVLDVGTRGFGAGLLEGLEG